MRIDGAGGCFDNRVYEIDPDFAWQMALLTINEMGVLITDQDDSLRLIHFRNKKKFMQVCVQVLDDGTVQVIMDSTKKYLEIYSWKPENQEVNLFFEIFEKKLRQYRAFVICPECSTKVSSLARFCPQCGCKLK